MYPNRNKKMLPPILAIQFKKEIVGYLETTFPMTNEPFNGLFQKLFAIKNLLYFEPYIAVRLIFCVAEEMPACFEAIHPK